MFELIDFLELIGFGSWAEKYIINYSPDSSINFSDFVFTTLPPMLQLFFIVFILNWVMGIISDGCKLRFGGRM